MKMTEIWREVVKREFEHDVMQLAKTWRFTPENSEELLQQFYGVFRQAQITFEPRLPVIETRFLNTYTHRPASKRAMMAKINAYILTEHFARQCAEQLFDLYLTEANNCNHDVNVVISMFTGEGVERDLFTNTTS